MNGYLHESAVELGSSEENMLSGPGERLKKCRESHGLTHADVAGHLNLRISVIEAIEENNYRLIPKLVFARGYLRSYSKLLKLPSDEIIEAFEKLKCPENPSELPASPLRAGQKKPIKKEHSLLPWMTLVILLAIFATVGFWKPITHFLTNAQTPPAATNEVSAVSAVDNLASSAPTQTPQAGSNTPSQESPAALPDLDQFKQEN